MIGCPGCKALHPLNTVFCDECGECLIGDGGEREPVAASLSRSAISRRVRSNDGTIPGQHTISGDESVITLAIGETGDTVCVPLDVVTVLGRLDEEKSNYPDVDLSVHGGLEAGVSRRHARIYCELGEVVIEDLGSANGSVLNGEQLLPYATYALGDGDELWLGRMKIAVAI